MLKTILPREMKRVEQKVMAETGVAGAVLMERAAASVALAAARLSRERPGEALCLCGTGNNGGDGLAAMRIMASENKDFRGCCWLLPGALSPDAAYQLERLKGEQPHIRLYPLTAGALTPVPDKIACVIDALFGTGLSRPLEGLAAQLCEMANRLEKAGVPVLAVDIPSGLDGAAGAVLGAAVKATETVTFHRPKPGLYLRSGLDCAGAVTVADIGLPPALDDAEGFAVLEENDVSRLLPSRKRASHKGNYGRVLIWAGKRGMAGAAAICATAALRAGAGLVTVACPESVLDVVQILCPCATCIPLPENDPSRALALLREGCGRADALGVGCGLGRERDTAFILRELLTFLGTPRETNPLPMVLDADGLNLLAGLREETAGNRRSTEGSASSDAAGRVDAFTAQGIRTAFPALENAWLTPHPAEAARLLGEKTEAVLADPAAAALRLREIYGASVVAKGATSVLAAREGVALNVLGTPAMAKGGSGDALTGVLTALLAGRAAGAYAMTDLELLQVGCGLHGLAGMAAEKRRGQRGVLATDLCGFLGQRFPME